MTLLVKVAHDVSGDKAIAATASSPLFPSHELEEAIELARWIGIEHILIKTGVFQDPRFVANPPHRCYYCKKDLSRRLKEKARALDLNYVAFGVNLDDLSDYRPGLEALREEDIRCPLAEAKLTKGDIRELSKRLGLPTQNKPSFTCLATRFPYGIKIAPKDLKKIEKAEAVLRQMGIRQFRVRDHGRIARIEIDPEDMVKLLGLRKKLVKTFKELGYLYVTLDLEGYRMGSMDEALNEG